MWKIRLVGDTGDLANLAKSLNGEEFNVSFEGDEYVLSSNHFLPSDDSRTVKEKAEKIVTFLNAGCRLTLCSRHSIKIGSVTWTRDDGKRDIFVFPEPLVLHWRVNPPSLKITRNDGTVEQVHPADSLAKWLPLGMTKERVANVLRILESTTLDWVNLYRVFEIIRDDVGGTKGITDAGWATRATLELFKRTANSPSAVGLEARHGSQSTQPPANPMSIKDARRLIDKIVRAWLRLRE